jgi:hypothetical protein
MQMVQQDWTLPEGPFRVPKASNTKGEDIITFVDEFLHLSYAKSTWWIDSGATIHVANSL